MSRTSRSPGPLEDVVGLRTIDREAAINEKFAWPLGGVWYDSEPAEIRKRLDAIVQGRHWAS